MRASVFFASVLALGAFAPLACTQSFGIFDPQGTGSSTGGTGGTMVTTTTSTGMGGTGGAPECVMGDACSDQNQCTTDACDTATGKCTHTALPDGPDMMGANLPGDCLAPRCFSGMPMQVADDTDVPKDGNPCTHGSCDNGNPKNTNLGTDQSCGQDLYCDGEGNCVGCTMDDQCANPGECQYVKCENKQCVVHDSSAGNSCNDGGGVVCNGMGDCVDCISDMGCTGSKICISNNCATSCNSGKKDGKETDTDCGGPCNKCVPGKMCNTNSDCTTNNCSGNMCVAAPTCSDSTKNGAETDTDCGGGTCPKCAIGLMCVAGSDCVSNTCVGNVCVAATPTCSDGTMNGTETDTDCGGATCPVCANTKKCAVNTDCLSLSCVANACTSTTCSNGMKDGSETSVDCGGSCTKCPNNKACMVSTDCQSGNCMANICAP